MVHEVKLLVTMHNWAGHDTLSGHKTLLSGTIMSNLMGGCLEEDTSSAAWGAGAEGRDMKLSHDQYAESRDKMVKSVRVFLTIREVNVTNEQIKKDFKMESPRNFLVKDNEWVRLSAI